MEARKEIVQKFHQILRDAGVEGDRIGTGLHRNHNWAGGNGNAQNAAKVAEGWTNKVCDSISPVGDTNCSEGNGQTAKCVCRNHPDTATGWGSSASGCRSKYIIPVGM